MRLLALTLAGAICLLPRSALLAQFQPGSHPSETLDRFPKTMTAEAFRGETTVLSGTLVFYLAAGGDRYAPIGEEMAKALSVRPLATAPPGLAIRPIASTCEPVEVAKIQGSEVYRVRGGKLFWSVECAPNASTPLGVQTVRVTFPMIDMAQRMVSPEATAERPEVRIAVRVWASRQARDEEQRRLQEQARRAKEERLQAERRADEQRLQAERQAAQSRARERAERRAVVIRHALPFVGLALAFGGVRFHLRRWRRPNVKIAMDGKTHVQKRAAATSLPADDGVPFGTIVETSWGCTRLGQRRPLKVEYLTGVAERSRPPDVVDVAFGVARHDSSQFGTNWSASNARLDVLVTIGASLKPGQYLATGRHGAVLVTVA